MTYDYAEMRSGLFTEDGVKMLTKIRDHAFRLIKAAGAARADRIWSTVTGDSWLMIAALDYLVEQDDLREVTPAGTVTQYRVFSRWDA